MAPSKISLIPTGPHVPSAHFLTNHYGLRNSSFTLTSPESRGHLWGWRQMNSIWITWKQYPTGCEDQKGKWCWVTKATKMFTEIRAANLPKTHYRPFIKRCVQSQSPWYRHRPVVPATWKTEAGGSLEPKTSAPAWAPEWDSVSEKTNKKTAFIILRSFSI